jgi:hypothetical protein
MKKLFLALAFLAPAILLAQAPPILRHGFTTNYPNTNQFLGNAVRDGAPFTNINSHGTFSVATGGQIQFLERANTIPAFDGTGLITEITVGTGLNYDTGTATLTAGADATTTSVLAGTNNAAVTNLTLSVLNALTTIDLTNNATSTNFIGLAAGTFRNATFVFRPLLVNRTNCYPIGTQYGQTWKTNVNAPLFTSLTQGVYYVLSLTTIDDTVLASMSAWQP